MARSAEVGFEPACSWHWGRLITAAEKEGRGLIQVACFSRHVFCLHESLCRCRACLCLCYREGQATAHPQGFSSRPNCSAPRMVPRKCSQQTAGPATPLTHLPLHQWAIQLLEPHWKEERRLAGLQ